MGSREIIIGILVVVCIIFAALAGALAVSYTSKSHAKAGTGSRAHTLPVQDLDGPKLGPQRVWPFPNALAQGTATIYVAPLRRADVDASVDSTVVNEFNAFLQLQRSPAPAPGGAPRTRIEVRVTTPSDSEDESYTLTADAGSGVLITAPGRVGAVYGLQTLQQLIRGSDAHLDGCPVRIQDSPRVPYRGLMLDCARHFLPLDTLLAQVRAMCFHKLNVLHLHLTDGQSFPLAVGPATAALSLPQPSAANNGNTGAFSAKEVYTAADIQALVTYARAHGVRVVPEVDTPGHSHSWISGHPEIMACAGPEDQYQAVCPEPPCGFFNLTGRMGAVQQVVQGVLQEVCAAFQVGRPGFSPWLHIGFDEVGCPSRAPTGACQKPSCVEAFGAPSVAYGNWLLAWAKARGVKVLMWVDQVLTSNFPGGGSTGYTPVLQVDPAWVTLQFWNMDATTPGQLAALAVQGFSLINSQSTVYYLDAGGEGNSVFWGGPLKSVPPGVRGSGASSDAVFGPAAVQYQKYWMATYPGVTGVLPNGWPTSWEDIYGNNPGLLPTSIGADTPTTAGYVAVPVASALGRPGIVGACVCAWGEQIDATNVDTRVWPKTSGLAESLWRFSPQRMPDTLPNARLRLAYAREDLLRLGVRAAPVVPGDLFRLPPWGPIGPGSSTRLMYDVNSASPQYPSGYTLTFRRFWGAQGICTTPLNPYCGDELARTIECGDPTAASYVQQGC